MEGFSEMVYYFYLTGSMISLISSLISIMFYICNTEIHNLALRIVFHAQCANFLVSLTSCLSFLVMYTFGCEHDTVLCLLHGFFMNFFIFLAILIVSNISYVLFLSIFYHQLQIQKISNYILLANIAVSALMSLIPLFLSNYGLAPQICSIKRDWALNNKVFIFQVAFYFLPIWVVLLSNFYFYFRCISYLKNTILDLRSVRLVENLIYYPVFLVFCFIFMTVFRIIDSFFRIENEAFTVIAVFLSTLNGVSDSLLFFTHPQVVKFCRSNSQKNSRITQEGPSPTMKRALSTKIGQSIILNSSQEVFINLGENMLKTPKNSDFGDNN